MSGKIYPGNPKEWESYANKLLTLHYGPGNYQVVPDRGNGDAGLEGFSMDGCAYQSYCVIEPQTHDVRLTYQKKKITTDIKKFIDNGDKLRPLLGKVVIKSWILLVPYFDSRDLIAHGQKKAEDVRAAKLAYADRDFHILIHTEDEFSEAAQRLRSVGLGSISLDAEPASDGDIDTWLTENASSTMLSHLQSKLSRIPACGTEDELKHHMRQFVKYFISGQNHLHQLRERYPELYECLTKLKANREQYLQTQSLFSPAPESNALGQALQKFQQDLQDNMGILGQIHAEAFVYEAVADWLMRCPLNPGR